MVLFPGNQDKHFYFLVGARAYYYRDDAPAAFCACCRSEPDHRH